MAGLGIGRGGHNRLPDAVKQTRGTERKCRTNPAAPAVAPAKVPAPPDELRADERPIWARLAACVEELGVYAAGDFDSFWLMVAAVAYAHRLQRDDDASPNQIVAASRSAAAHLAGFGLQPAARGKVSRAGAPEVGDDPLAEFVQ